MIRQQSVKHFLLTAMLLVNLSRKFVPSEQMPGVTFLNSAYKVNQIENWLLALVMERAEIRGFLNVILQLVILVMQQSTAHKQCKGNRMV